LEIKEAEELRKRILAVEKKSQDTLTVKWGKWYASNQNRESLAKAKLKNLFQQEWKSQAEEEATQKCKEVLSLIATKEQEKVEQAGSILKELLPDLVPNDAPHSQRVDKIVSFTLEALVEKVFQYCEDQFTKARLADQLAEVRDEIDAEFKLAQEEEQRILKEQLKKFQAEFAETMKRHKAELTRTKDWKEFAKENTNKAKSGISVSTPSLLQVKSENGYEEIIISESTKYFTCKKDLCSGGLCLHCKKPVDKVQISSHECDNDPIVFLYEQVLDTLARASSRTCPMCFAPGMKDLGCTHISCDCGTHWCYHCGRDESQMEYSTFDQHNGWSRNTPEGIDRCPMYLHDKYCTVEEMNTPEFNENEEFCAEVALNRFHKKLQQEAIQRLEEISDPNHWSQMLDKYFPNGILT
jgi:hypothetical protein